MKMKTNADVILVLVWWFNYLFFLNEILNKTPLIRIEYNFTLYILYNEIASVFQIILWVFIYQNKFKDVKVIL